MSQQTPPRGFWRDPIWQAIGVLATILLFVIGIVLSHLQPPGTSSTSTNNPKGEFSSTLTTAPTITPTASPISSTRVIYVGSSDHSIYALRASDGSLLWQYKTGGEVNAGIIVVTWVQSN